MTTKTKAPRPARGSRDESGHATVMVILLALSFVAMAGLVIDGGYALASKRRAMNHADQAARVGSDALDEGSLRSGINAVNAAQAQGAARSYLRRVGASGTVRVSGGEVTVTVTDSSKTTLLNAVGVNSLGVSATATAVSIDEDGR